MIHTCTPHHTMYVGETFKSSGSSQNIKVRTKKCDGDIRSLSPQFDKSTRHIFRMARVQKSLSEVNWCRSFVDSVVFLVTPCKFPIFLNIGHIRQGRLLDDSGTSCHKNTHRIGGSRQWAKSKFQGAQHNGHKCRITSTRMAIAPNIHRDRDHTSHINVTIMKNNVTAFMPPTPSTRQCSPDPILLKYCRSPNALKWPYLSRILSELNDSKCVGFPTGPRSAKKLSLLNFDCFKVQLHNTWRRSKVGKLCKSFLTT